MDRASTIESELSTTIGGPIGPRRSPKFSRVARVLWPRKTAAELAFRARVTERAAKRWLSGHRKPSALAVQVIVNEIILDT